MLSGEVTEYPRLEHDARYKSLPDIALRLKTFLGGGYNGQYSTFNLSSKLTLHRLDDVNHVEISVWSPPGLSKPTFAEAVRQTYRPTKKGETFGPPWSNHWFRVTLRIPPEWHECERVQLEWDASGEALVYSEDGQALQGISGDSVRFDRNEFIISPNDCTRDFTTYYIEASCYGMVGQTHDPPQAYLLRTADLVVPNMEVWRLKWDFEVLKEVYEDVPDTQLGQECLHAANAAMTAFKKGKPEQILAAGAACSSLLATRPDVTGRRVPGLTWALGHCHIDLANLWQFTHSQQKAARSWSSQLRLMDQYLDYTFTVTQAQSIKWVEDLYPDLFKRIMARAEEGRFEALGATWVECDTNLPTGESLCRQFMFGQRYYQSRFGHRSKVFALPDSFGFSSQLPQISRLCDAPFFYTQKMSWNLENHFPHTSFNWIGLDGSQLLAHMSPTELYSSTTTIPEIRMNITNHANTDVSSDAIFLFGHGDGGGGPTGWMMERLQRLQALAGRREAGGLLTQIKMDGSFEQFYEHLRETTNNGETLSTWKGEMYLERHRACQTSQAAVKKANRKLELLLREVELLSTLASLTDRTVGYPHQALDSIWERFLLNQFHDVLAGSAFDRVYADVIIINRALFAELHEMRSAADAVLFGSQKVTINSRHGVARTEVVPAPDNIVVLSTGTQTHGQCYIVYQTTPESHHLIARPIPIPDICRPASIHYSGDTLTVSSSTISITFDNGRITSLVDTLQDRQLIPEGRSSGLTLFDDRPHDYDAWEIESYGLDAPEELCFEDLQVLENGPLRTTLTSKVQVGERSSMMCNIVIDSLPASPHPRSRQMIRFDAKVHWHDHHQLLCFSLPLEIYSDYATYDSQFGVNKRPTHRNTSWDAAKFEVCGHSFADLSEYGYGVALINESKYGYGVRGNVMRLSLLRGPTEPDKEADMGEHEFSWAIYPHEGLYEQSDVADVAAAFNSPLRVVSNATRVHDSEALAVFPFKLDGSPNVVLETVKRGEYDAKTGNCTVILRLCERYGGSARSRLHIDNLDVKKVELVNILEDPLEDLTVTEAEGHAYVSLRFRAFEIKTVRVTVEV